MIQYTNSVRLSIKDGLKGDTWISLRRKNRIDSLDRLGAGWNANRIRFRGGRSEYWERWLAMKEAFWKRGRNLVQRALPGILEGDPSEDF